MASPVRRAVQNDGVSFGDMGMYTRGGAVPEGDYIWKEVNVQMYQPQANKQGQQGPARLSVVLTLLPLTGGEEIQQPYSMGTKAHESFQPNATGKGLVSVPGGPASTFNDSTNWAILLKSLRDSGLPEGIFTNDVSTLEGMHVHMANVPEPAERASFRSQTGEVAAEQKKPGTILVVSEIKDDGKPWEGTGGIPEAEAPAPAPAKVAPKAAVAAAAKVKAKAAPVPAVVEEEAVEADEDLEAMALAAISTVLSKSPKGMSRIGLRSSSFKYLVDHHGPDTCQSVMDTYFSTDAALDGLLGPAGFKLDKMNIVPA